MLQLKTELIAILIALLVLVGGYAYNLHGRIETLEQSVAVATQAAADNLKAKEQSDLSCKATTELLEQYRDKQEGIGSSQQAAGDAINSLPTLTIKETANASPTKPQAFSDNDRLSPDTMRLLDKAYCDGDKDSCASTAQGATKSLRP